MRVKWLSKTKQNLAQIPRRYWIIAAMVLAVLILVAIHRMYDAYELRVETKQEAIPTVAVIKADHGPVVDELILPANIVAWHEATIYARTNGYIKAWYVDIGARVTKGQVLADIETPEVDQQLRQSEADLKTAEANDALAQVTATRWLNLLKTDSVSKQETDEKVSQAKATAATVLSVRANRDRLRDLVNFKKVVAPFDGIISARMTDIGALINAGRNDFPALFHIVQTNPLRIYVRIPQYYSARLKPGMSATIEFAEHPGKAYPVTLLQTADAIDAASRTLLAQFVIDNSQYDLLPGGYTQIHLRLDVPDHVVRLPVNTLLFGAKGLEVAVVGKDNIATLRKITINRDFGDVIEVTNGVTTGEEVILDPPDALISGQKVRIAKPKPRDKKQ